MVGQASPLGTLAPSLPQVVAVGVKAQQTSENARPVKNADLQPSAAPGRSVVDAGAGPEEAVKQVNSHLEHAGSEVRMQVDKGSGRPLFQVISAGTGEVLLQVPSVEVLAMARKLKEITKQKGASGVLLDKEG